MSGSLFLPCWLINYDGSVEDWYFRGPIDNGTISLIEKQGESIRAVPNYMIRLKKCGDCVYYTCEGCVNKFCSARPMFGKDTNCCPFFMARIESGGCKLFVKNLMDDRAPICNELKELINKESED